MALEAINYLITNHFSNKYFSQGDSCKYICHLLFIFHVGTVKYDLYSLSFEASTERNNG